MTDLSKPDCKICGQPASVWIRTFTALAPVRDDKGQLWAGFKPGGVEGFCRAHIPRPEPLEAGLLC